MDKDTLSSLINKNKYTHCYHKIKFPNSELGENTIKSMNHTSQSTILKKDDLSKVNTDGNTSYIVDTEHKMKQGYKSKRSLIHSHLSILKTLRERNEEFHTLSNDNVSRAIETQRSNKVIKRKYIHAQLDSNIRGLIKYNVFLKRVETTMNKLSLNSYYLQKRKLVENYIQALKFEVNINFTDADEHQMVIDFLNDTKLFLTNSKESHTIHTFNTQVRKYFSNEYFLLNRFTDVMAKVIPLFAIENDTYNSQCESILFKEYKEHIIKNSFSNYNKYNFNNHNK